MIIDCISDLHGYYPQLEGGDLLIVAGDLTARDTFEQHADFKTWLYKQNYRKKIVIAGNHDNHFVGLPSDPYIFSSYNTKTAEQISYAEYLCDSGTEFEGLKIWGSPWTKTFAGMNPECKAFTVDTKEELAVKFALIPKDTDILITHGPPYGILDKTIRHERAGSISLRNTIFSSDGMPKLKYVIFGHIHEAYGKIETTLTTFINCSYLNEQYKPVNKPVKIEL